MTVPYSNKVATANFSVFFKLLIRWRGSIFKIIWKEFAVFSLIHFLLSLTYRFLLPENYKRYYEFIAQYCAQYNSLIPVTFVLGFYVTHVANLWWEKFKMLPWPGGMAYYVKAYMQGDDENTALRRRDIMRYLCLSFIMIMTSICPSVRKRFPTLDKVVEEGFLTLNEKQIIVEDPSPYNKFFIPLVWASDEVMKVRQEGNIKSDIFVNVLNHQINEFREKLFHISNYEWITIPLVYTQVVTFAVYTYFLSCLMGRQYLEVGQSGDLLFPFFTYLQFLVYVGLLKVAETMLNPFGEDDDDFDINYLVNRHLKMSLGMVDLRRYPVSTKDQCLDDDSTQQPHKNIEISINDNRRGSANDIGLQEGKESMFGTPMFQIEDSRERELFDCSFKPLNLKRTISKASNLSKISQSLKPLNWIRSLRRSSYQQQNNNEELFYKSETHISSNSLKVTSPPSERSVIIDIENPRNRIEEGIFSMSLEDLTVDVDHKKVESKTLYKKDSSMFEKLSKLKPNIQSKGGNIRRNNTDSNLEIERDKEGYKFLGLPRNSINPSIVEVDEDLSDTETNGTLMDDGMQGLREIQKKDVFTG